MVYSQTILEDIHVFPNLFVQQEHTAQVDKSVAQWIAVKVQGSYHQYSCLFYNYGDGCGLG